jgi:hypothetical protein
LPCCALFYEVNVIIPCLKENCTVAMISCALRCCQKELCDGIAKPGIDLVLLSWIWDLPQSACSMMVDFISQILTRPVPRKIRYH